MNKRRFMLVLATGGASIALSACEDMPPSAIAPWQGPQVGLIDPRLRALSWALLAPNPHNLQSWIADIREPGLIKLSVDTARLLPETDPQNRQILLGCGAFLELLRMAASHDGHRAEISLLPQGDYDAKGVHTRIFAQIRLIADRNVVSDPLFLSVRERRTNRQPYDARVPDAATLTQLATSTLGPGIRLAHTTNVEQVARLRELAIAGYHVEFTAPATWSESGAVIRIGTDAIAAEPSGLPLLGSEIWWGRKLGLVDRAAMMDSAGVGSKRAIEGSSAAAAATPTWAWLVSQDNSRRSQLETGRAYLRLNLKVTQLGMAIHPNSQVLQEFPAMATLYERFHQEVGVSTPARVQMLVRLGYAPEVGPSPRRAIERLLRT